MTFLRDTLVWATALVKIVNPEEICIDFIQNQDFKHLNKQNINLLGNWDKQSSETDKIRF